MGSEEWVGGCSEQIVGIGLSLECGGESLKSFEQEGLGLVSIPLGRVAQPKECLKEGPSPGSSLSQC